MARNGACIYAAWIELYLARRLDELLSSVLELHLFACERCLEALELERRRCGHDRIPQLHFMSRSWH
jgi:hypothetical protein